MASTDTDASAARLASEREKWEAETALKERELVLKERDQKNHDLELELKQAEQVRSRWTNPLTVAVAGAAFVGLINSAAVWWSARLQRNLEQQKADQQLSLDESKAES